MSDRIVEEAYNRAKSRFSEEQWFSLPPRAVTDEIYKEIRQIDAERVNSEAARPNRSARNAFAA
ncbi:MAG: hypothetical protein JSS43_25740 [Proteobacteria bacterium]|nr:hypothetical protein [Pseudomonadota bacterium]